MNGAHTAAFEIFHVFLCRFARPSCERSSTTTSCSCLTTASAGMGGTFSSLKNAPGGMGGGATSSSLTYAPSGMGGTAPSSLSVARLGTALLPSSSLTSGGARAAAAAAPLTSEEDQSELRAIPSGAVLKKEGAVPPMPPDAYVKDEEVAPPPMPPGTFFKVENVPLTPSDAAVKQEHEVVVEERSQDGRVKRQKKQ